MLQGALLLIGFLSVAFAPSPAPPSPPSLPAVVIVVVVVVVVIAVVVLVVNLSASRQSCQQGGTNS